MDRREFLKYSAAGAVTLAASRLVRAQVRGGAAAPGAAGVPSGAAVRKEPYILGADVSWLLEDEGAGATYWDRGVKMDLLDILKKYNFNYIRARIFVNPAAPGGYSRGGYCDLEHTKKFAQRIQAAGLGFLLSFHFSDTWSSPGSQKKPAAWANLGFDDLVKAVHDWVAGVLKGLKENETPPTMVSVGNETSDGVLFPDGRATNFDNFAKLINAGCLAVREFNPKIPIALHHHMGRDNAVIRAWVDNFLQRKTEFDVIGMSCYAEGTKGNFAKNFNDIAVRYPKLSFAALEYSHDKRYTNDQIFNAPNAKGLGSFIWEPTRWREAIFDKDGLNAGDDDNNKPHMPASTLPPLPAGARAATGSTPAAGPAPAAAPAPASAPQAGLGRGLARRGGRYDTNEHILPYPEMAKAYRVIKG